MAKQYLLFNLRSGGVTTAQFLLPRNDATVGRTDADTLRVTLDGESDFVFVNGDTYIKGSVATYADLPAASAHTAEFWLVQEATGIWLINRKPAGLYVSDGAAWHAAPDVVPFFDDDNFRIYDHGDTTKQIRIDAGGITAGQTREITMADQDIDLTPNASYDAAGEAASVAADLATHEGLTGSAVHGLDNIATKKSNLTATTAPGAGDDSGDGYAVGSVWVDTVGLLAYQAVDVTLGAAVWTKMLPSGLPAVDIFTSSGTWTKRSGAKVVEYQMIGPGGGGASGRLGASGTNRGGGGGGGGGARTSGVVSASVCGATESVTVGAAGIGGAGQTTSTTNGLAGTSGGATSFGAIARAGGGGGGTGGSTAGGAAGASGKGGDNGGDGSAGGLGSYPSTPSRVGTGGAGGCGGSGVNTADQQLDGRDGGAYCYAFAVSGGGGTGGMAPGGDGGDGSDVTSNLPYGGGGGGSGASAASGDGGDGGDGGDYGGGGGGGGAASNGNTSGAGGNGGAGIAVVVTY
jgi:hypothetical protein